MKSGATSASSMRPRWASTTTRSRRRTPAAVSDINALSAAATGAALGLGLIVAIGAQNALFLRKGLHREHVGHVVALCALCDAVLMTAGVAGLAQLLGI